MEHIEFNLKAIYLLCVALCESGKSARKVKKEEREKIGRLRIKGEREDKKRLS